MVPGTVIHHSPSQTGCYVGCPSIAILADGDYVATHSHFGPGSTNDRTFVYRSSDRGATWHHLAGLHGQIWSGLFVHRGELYLMGTDHCDTTNGRLNGRMVIRRSRDEGETWSVPADAATGLLSDEEGYHTAPVPVALHQERIWRAMEFAPDPDRTTWRPLVLSARVDADLLDRRSWKRSRLFDHPWQGAQCIEGNVVVAPDDSLVNILRCNRVDFAAIARVFPDGSGLEADCQEDLIPFPGGGSKFTIRLHEPSALYWALTNPRRDPTAKRNRLCLMSSPDLRRWDIRRLVLAHPDPEYHAFQYVDWRFDGDDIVFVSRTAYDDGEGGAHNYHDANYLSFHRIHGFRAEKDPAYVAP